MLDLDSLASKCAVAAGEPEDQWRGVIWSEDFQRVSQKMSDGEVETMVINCESIVHFENLVRFLISHPELVVTSPYELMDREARNRGVTIRDWIQSLARGA